MLFNKNKYRVSKKEERTYNGIVFDSKKELARYKVLIKLLDEGKISKLERQVTFLLQDKFEYRGEKIRAITYKADFEYYNEEGYRIIEDVKGFKTPEYKLKKKMLLNILKNDDNVIFLET